MDSLRNNESKEELFTLRTKETKANNLTQTLSPLCDKSIYSQRNNKLLKNDNDCSTTFNICIDDKSDNPPKKYLSAYSRAVAICEDFFIQNKLTFYNPGEYKELLLTEIKSNLKSPIDSILLREIDKYIDYYLIKERVQADKSSFNYRDLNGNGLKDQMERLKEEIAIMDLNYGLDHFWVKRKHKERSIKHFLNSNISFNNSKTIQDGNNEVKSIKKSLEENILIRKIIEKDEKILLTRNNSQPLIDIQRHTFNPEISNIPMEDQIKNKNTVSNIFTSIYKNNHKLYLKKIKWSDIEKADRSPDSVQKSFNKSSDSFQFFDPKQTINSMNKTSILNQHEQNKNQLDRTKSSGRLKSCKNQMYLNSSLPSLNNKENNLLSSMRSTTTNNTCIKNNNSFIESTKRINSINMIIKDSQENDLNNPLIRMKQYQSSLRRNTSVPNYKPNKKSIKGKTISTLNQEYKRVIPFVYKLQKKAPIHFKQLSLKRPNQSNNDFEWSLKLLFKSYLIKVNHNTLLLILLKASAIYNKEKRLKKAAKGYRNSSISNKYKCQKTTTSQLNPSPISFIPKGKSNIKINNTNKSLKPMNYLKYTKNVSFK